MIGLPKREKGPANVFMHEFSVGMKRQTIWGVPHATWFFAMGIGGGLYLTKIFGLSLGEVFGLPVLDVVSIVLILIGGNILIADLGRPKDFLKALRHPERSWIARGAIADFVFGIAGAAAIIPQFDIGSKPFAFLPWTPSTPFGVALQVVTAVAGVVVMTYAGFVMAASPSIPAWNTRLVPLQFFLFGISGALGIYYLAAPPLGVTVNVSYAASIGVGAVLLNLLATVAYVFRARGSLPAARESMKSLLHGAYAKYFVGFVLILGLVLPVLLLLTAFLSAGVYSLALAAVSGAALLVGNFFFRFALLRTGTYGPYIKLDSLLQAA